MICQSNIAHHPEHSVATETLDSGSMSRVMFIQQGERSWAVYVKIQGDGNSNSGKKDLEAKKSSD